MHACIQNEYYSPYRSYRDWKRNAHQYNRSLQWHMQYIKIQTLNKFEVVFCSSKHIRTQFIKIILFKESYYWTCSCKQFSLSTLIIILTQIKHKSFTFFRRFVSYSLPFSAFSLYNSLFSASSHALDLFVQVLSNRLVSKEDLWFLWAGVVKLFLFVGII